jgi:iron(III) transport system permease protein
MGTPPGPPPVDAAAGSRAEDEAPSPASRPGPGQRLSARIRTLRQEPAFGLTAVAMGALVVVFILVPIAYVLVESVYVGGELSLANWRAVPTTGRFRSAIYNSLLLGVFSTGLTVLFAVPLALYTTRHPGPLSRAFRVIALLPLVAPPFVFSLSLMLVAGRRGILTDMLRPGLELLGFTNPGIFGLHGVVIAQMLGFFPVAYMLIESSLRSIDPSIEQAAHDLGANQFRTIRDVTLPLAQSGIAKAFLIVFVLVLADFSNPLLLGAGQPTLASEAFISLIGRGNREMAAVLGTILIIPGIAVFLAQRYWLGGSDDASISQTAGGANLPLNPQMRALVLAPSLLLSLGIVVLFGFLVTGAFVRVIGVNWTPTLDHFALGIGGPFLRNSFLVSLGAAVVASLLGVIQGYVLARRDVPAAAFQEFTSLFGLAVPGTVIGIGYILAFNQPPLALTGTLAILVINMAFRNIGVSMSGAIAKLEQVDPSFEEAARDLGAGSVRTFLTVGVPLLLPPLMAGFVYTFMTTMVTISSVIFLVSPGTQLAAVYIFSLADTGRLGQASAMTVLLIGIVLVALGLLRWLERRSNLGL